jgi:hypothetical protein
MVRIRRRHGIQLRSCWVPAFSRTTQRSAGYLAEPEGVFPRLFRKSLVSFVRPFLALELVAGDVVATLVAPTPARRPVTALKMPTTAATINKTAPIPPTATTSGSGALCRGFSNAVDGCSALRPPLASSPESWPGGIVRPGTQPASTNSTRLPRPLNTPYTDNAGRNAEPAVPMLAMKKTTIGITSMVPSRNVGPIQTGHPISRNRPTSAMASTTIRAVSTPPREVFTLWTAATANNPCTHTIGMAHNQKVRRSIRCNDLSMYAPYALALLRSPIDTWSEGNFKFTARIGLHPPPLAGSVRLATGSDYQ